MSTSLCLSTPLLCAPPLVLNFVLPGDIDDCPLLSHTRTLTGARYRKDRRHAFIGFDAHEPTAINRHVARPAHGRTVPTISPMAPIRTVGMMRRRSSLSMSAFVPINIAISDMILTAATAIHTHTSISGQTSSLPRPAQKLHVRAELDARHLSLGPELAHRQPES